ncbi:MAG TPA: hypothetical protein QF776_08510, partial [Acidimicrobiales bacterium]|nr:hypothetical protein [Acidimicrobiales bacterium]
EIKVMGIMPIIRDEEGIDLDATMEGIPELVETGVTDFRAYLPVPMGIEEATDYLSNIVERFNETLI